jgi:cysteine desulfurase
MIYFDHNATTPLDDRVLEAMLPFLTTFYGNPSSLYRLGRLARSAIDTAREQVAALVGAQANQIIFTSGGTEANNLAFYAVSQQSKIAVSAIEHPSVSEPAERLRRQGHLVMKLNVDANGLVNDEVFNAFSWEQGDFISIMMANNETGVIQNIAEWVGFFKGKGLIFHTDAVQALGKIPVNFNRLEVDLMTLSSHKIYGPKGCGALVFNKEISLKPLITGGGQESSHRGGTENVAAIVGFGKAAELAMSKFDQNVDRSRKLREFLEAQIKSVPNLTIFSEKVDRLPNTTLFGISGIDGEMMVMQLDQKGIAVSSGSACASGGGEPSPVLTAMQVEQDLSKSAIRISLGLSNTEQQINEFMDQFNRIICGVDN